MVCCCFCVPLNLTVERLNASCDCFTIKAHVHDVCCPPMSYVTEEGFLLDVFVNVLYSILLNSCSVYHNKCLCSDL